MLRSNRAATSYKNNMIIIQPMKVNYCRKSTDKMGVGTKTHIKTRGNKCRENYM